MRTLGRWWNQLHRVWYWRKIKQSRERMHALLRQWDIWKIEYPNNNMFANDCYFHNLGILVTKRDRLFKKIRKYKAA